MNFEFDFPESKWFLLKELERGPLSPKELADLTNTSIANTSQQLKLLEAQGYLKKVKKKGNFSRQDRDARVLYELSKPKIWITKISNSHVDRKLLKNSNDFLLNLMLCDIKDISHVVKFFLNREDLFKKIDCIYFLQTMNTEVHFLVITNELDFFRKDNHSFSVDFSGKTINIKFWSHSFEEFKQGLTKSEPYFIDLTKKAQVVFCENDNVKNLLKEWKQ